MSDRKESPVHFQVSWIKVQDVDDRLKESSVVFYADDFVKTQSGRRLSIIAHMGATGSIAHGSFG